MSRMRARFGRTGIVPFAPFVRDTVEGAQKLVTDGPVGPAPRAFDRDPANLPTTIGRPRAAHWVCGCGRRHRKLRAGPGHCLPANQCPLCGDVLKEEKGGGR